MRNYCQEELHKDRPKDPIRDKALLASVMNPETQVKYQQTMESFWQETEGIRLMSVVCVGGEGVGGYTVKNTSRSSYILPRYSQEFSLTVDIWNQVGRQFFKDILRRINSGGFN